MAGARFSIGALRRPSTDCCPDLTADGERGEDPAISRERATHQTAISGRARANGIDAEWAPGRPVRAAATPQVPSRSVRYLERSTGQKVLKRGFDLVVAVPALVLLAPVFGAIAVAIKLDSRGPVYFKQTRVGLHRRRFEIWKFRKMREDVPVGGPMVTRHDDVRMTRVGRVLEHTKLDELPQLVNVLRGEMSMVGPRPDVPKFVAEYPERWDVVLSVKPGIFGPSQNRFRHEDRLYPVRNEEVEPFYVNHILPRMLELDADYATQARLSRDVALLAGGILKSALGSLGHPSDPEMSEEP